MGGAFAALVRWPQTASHGLKAERGRRIKDCRGRLAETHRQCEMRESLKEAVKARGLVASTIVHHLEELAEIGKLTRADFAHLVPLDIVDEVHEALTTNTGDKPHPSSTLSTVVTHLKPSASFGLRRSSEDFFDVRLLITSAVSAGPVTCWVGMPVSLTISSLPPGKRHHRHRACRRSEMNKLFREFLHAIGFVDTFLDISMELLHSCAQQKKTGRRLKKCS